MKMLPLLLLMFSAITNANEANLENLKSCSQIKNDFKRLICYDKAFSGEKTAHFTNSNTSSDLAIEKATSQASSKDSTGGGFGLEYKKTSDVDSITSKVTKIDNKLRGELVINLENGHEWHQIGSSTFIIREGDTVTISRGVFNSFELKVAGRNKGIKVKRK